MGITVHYYGGPDDPAQLDVALAISRARFFSAWHV
jgi:hypothetical protein